jgi:hypothetical protein
MGLLLGDTRFGQVFNNEFRLDLELTCQLVDADLIRLAHCPPARLLSTMFVRRAIGCAGITGN